MTGKLCAILSAAVLAVLLAGPVGGGRSAGAQSTTTEVVTFGKELAALAAGGDAAAIAALAVTNSFTCPVDEVYRAQACDGKPDGTIVEGYTVGRLHSEGGVVDFAQLVDFIDAALQRFTISEIRLYTVTQAGDAIVLSTPGDAAQIAAAANVLTFGVRATANGYRIIATVDGFVHEGADGGSALVQGGKYGDAVYVEVGLLPPATGSGELAESSPDGVLLLLGALVALAAASLFLALVGWGPWTAASGHHR